MDRNNKNEREEESESDDQEENQTKAQLMDEINKLTDFKKHKKQIKSIESQLTDANKILYNINEQIKDVFTDEGIAQYEQKKADEKKKEKIRK